MLSELIWRGLLAVSPILPFLQPRHTKISSARSGDIEAQYGLSSPFKLDIFKIMYLPDNVLLSIMELLPVKDMVCLSMVNRRLNKLAQTPSIWISQARIHLALSCPLVIPPSILYELTNPHFFRYSVLLKATRSTVLLTSRLSHKWARPYATPVAQPCPRWLRILRGNSHHKIIHITPSYALLLREDVDMGHGAHELIRWDMRRNRSERLALRGALLSLRKERSMRTVHCVVGGYSAANAFENFEFRIMRVHVHGPSPEGSPPTLLMATSGITAINNLNGPSNNPLPMRKEILACFTMPFSSKIDVQILDVPSRVVAVLFECRKVPRGRMLRSGKKRTKVLDEITPTSTLGLGIIFNWQTRSSTILDTGIPFEFCNTSAVLQLGPNHSHLIIRTETNVYNERSGCNSRVVRTNSLDLIRLKKHGSSWEEAVRVASTSMPARTVTDSSTVSVDRTLGNDAVMWSQSTHEYEWTDDSLRSLLGSGPDPPLVLEPPLTMATICSPLHHHLHCFPYPTPSPTMHPFRLEDSQIASQYIFHQDWAAFRDIRSDIVSKHPLVSCEDAMPSRLSMATLFSVPSVQVGAGTDMLWYLSQSYVDASVEAVSALVNAGTNPYGNLTVPPPIIVPIRNPLLVERTVGLNHGSRVRFQPLLHVSFNYACWVEALIEDDVPSAPIQAEQTTKVAMWAFPLAFVATMKLQTSWAFRWRGQRRNPGIWILKAVIQNKVHKLKLVSFRGPEGARLRSSLGSGLRSKRMELARAKTKDRESVEVVQNVTTLEVSPEVVRNALYLWLDEMEGTATVVCHEGKVHTFSFA